MNIKLIGPDDPALAAARKAISAHPEWNLELQVAPWAEYRDLLMESLQAKETPNQAVFVPGHVWIPELADAKLISSLEPLISSLPGSAWEDYGWHEIFSSIQRDSSYLGQRYMVPYFNDAHILFYRKDLLDPAQADPLPEISPLNLPHLAEEAHNPPGVYGIALKAHPSEIFFDWLPFFYAAGGKIADEDLRPAFFSNAGIQALETYCSLREFAPPDTHTYGNEEIAQVLRQGKAALVTTWGGQAAPIFLDSANPFRDRYRSAVFPYPCGGTWGFALPANQSQEDQIKTLETLLVLNSSGMDQQVLIEAGSPIRLSTYTDQSFKQYPWLQAQYEILQRIVFLPFDPRIGIYLGHLTEALCAAFSGEKTPRNALKDANSRILEELAGSD